MRASTAHQYRDPHTINTITLRIMHNNALHAVAFGPSCAVLTAAALLPRTMQASVAKDLRVPCGHVER